MILKLLDYNSIQNDEQTHYLLRNGGTMRKHASIRTWSDEVKDFIDNLIPEEGKIYTLCNALGSGEFWSSNINGDFFPEKALQKYHPTFVEHGTPFMNHVNKDPKKGYGKILHSAYNPRMHRVEIITAYDRKLLPPKVIRKLENDEEVKLSMGCRVPYDICSICGNQAATPSNYCEHVKDLGMNHIYDDGRKVYVINDHPDFFDISIVIVPADRTACVMAKIASVPYEIRSADRAKELQVKKAEIESLQTVIDWIPDVTFKTIEKLAAATKTADCLAHTIDQNNVFLKPHEVQAAMLLQMKKIAAAKKLYDNKLYIEPQNYKMYRIKEAKSIPFPIQDRSMMQMPHTLPAQIHQFAQQQRMAQQQQAILSQMLNPEPAVSDASFLGLTPENLFKITSMTYLLGSMFGAKMSLLYPLAFGGMSLAKRLISGGQPAKPTLNQQLAAMAQTPPEDLMLAPLLYPKTASVITMKKLYSAPLAGALYVSAKNKGNNMAKTASLKLANILHGALEKTEK